MAKVLSGDFFQIKMPKTFNKKRTDGKYLRSRGLDSPHVDQKYILLPFHQLAVWRYGR